MSEIHARRPGTAGQLRRSWHIGTADRMYGPGQLCGPPNAPVHFAKSGMNPMNSEPSNRSSQPNRRSRSPVHLRRGNLSGNGFALVSVPLSRSIRPHESLLPGHWLSWSSSFQSFCGTGSIADANLAPVASIRLVASVRRLTVHRVHPTFRKMNRSIGIFAK